MAPISTAMSTGPPSRRGSHVLEPISRFAVSVFAMGPAFAEPASSSAGANLVQVGAIYESPLLLRASRMVRHVAARAGFFHRRLEVLMDLRILVFEFDLSTAELDAGKRAAFAVLGAHEFVAPVVPAQRQIARRLRAGIEVLMKPLIRRHHHAARPPVDPLHRFARRPENRIALSGKNDHVRARTMFVSLLVSPHRKFRDVRAHGVLGQVEFHVGAALAALAVIRELEGMRIGHEVGGEKESAGQFALAAEITFGARIEAVEKW